MYVHSRVLYKYICTRIRAASQKGPRGVNRPAIPITYDSQVALFPKVTKLCSGARPHLGAFCL